MSEVISFRLNKDNPRESQALEILEAWCLIGYSVRFVITDALIALNCPSQESAGNNTSFELNKTLDQVKKLLEQLGNGKHLGEFTKEEDSESSTLSDNFVASVRKAAKPGVNTK
jgi:hypothetical protein